MLLLGFDSKSDVTIPAGFGALGNANDGIHHDLHRIRALRERLLIGQSENIVLRKGLAQLGVSADGYHQPRLTSLEVIKGDVVSAWALNTWGDGKRIIHAWLSRGFNSVENMAKSHGKTVEEMMTIYKTKSAFKEVTN